MALVDTSIVSTPDRTASPGHSNPGRPPSAEGYQRHDRSRSRREHQEVLPQLGFPACLPLRPQPGPDLGPGSSGLPYLPARPAGIDLAELQLRPPRHPLFLPYHARPARPALLAHIYDRAKEKAGIDKPGGIHTLRHCYATGFLEAGVELHVIQRRLGHSSIRSTTRLRYYGLLANRCRARKLALCRDLLGQPAPEPRGPETAEETMLRLTGIDITACRQCGEGTLRQILILEPRHRTGAVAMKTGPP